MGFNPNDYEPVAVRLDRWLKTHTDQHPQVITHCVEYTADRCLFRAELFVDGGLVATGWAEEQRTDRGITAGSMVEVAETSAIGRALANCGYAGSDPSRRASREEMEKAQRYQPRTEGAETRQASGPRPATEAQLRFLKTLVAKKGTTEDFNYDTLTASEASRIIESLKGAPDVA